MKKETAGALYDKISRRYSENRSLALNDYTELPTVVRLAGGVKGKDILDVGCGTGKHAQKFVAKGAQVTGIDASEKMIAIARRNCKQGNFFQADFERVKFGAASFDIIVASLSLMYSSDVRRVIKKFARWLKPEGRLIFSIYHPVRFFHKIKDFDFSKSRKLWIHLQGCEVTVFNYYHPLEKYFAALAENGFELLNFIEPVLPKRYKGWPEDNYRVPRSIIFESRKR